VILLAHSIIKTFKNPAGDDYDRFGLRVHDKAAGLLKEWCDDVLFANYETFVSKDGNRPKGVSTGARLIFTERRAAWDAKNRHGLPETLPLDWETYFSAATAPSADSISDLRNEISSKIESIADDAKRAAAAAWFDKARNDASALRLGLNRINVLVGNNNAKEANQ